MKRALQTLGAVGAVSAGLYADNARGRRSTEEMLHAGREAAKFLGAPATRIAAALFGARKIQAADRRELERKPEFLEDFRGYECARAASICNAEDHAKADLAELAAGIAAFNKPLVLHDRRGLLPWTRRKLQAAIEADPEALVGLRALCYKRQEPKQTLYEIYLRASEDSEHPLNSIYADIFCMFGFMYAP